MNKIICPKCGQVKKYGILEKCHQTLIFSADGEPNGATELHCDFSGKPRCMRCNSLVKFVKEGDAE